MPGKRVDRKSGRFWKAFLLACAAMVCSLQHGRAQGRSGADACSAFTLKGKGLTLGQGRYVPAGLFVAPPGSNTPRGASLMLPPHCEIKIVDEPVPDSRIEVEVWLPDAAAWNGKLLATGNGGYSSGRSYADMADGLRRGYTVGGSDTGHEGDALSFGKDHPEKIRDWAYRAVHELAVIEKQVAQSFYGRRPEHAYFRGCSTGGQQALSEVQRYPSDFDGVIAGDPGNDRILLNADFFASWLTTHPEGAPSFPREKLAMLGRASVLACDKEDGVVDGVIGDPRQCTFDPVALRCAEGTNQVSCLTLPEVEMVRRLYAGALHDAAGKSLYFGWTRGSEAGWGPYLVSPAEPTRTDFWRQWVYHDPAFTLRSFEPVAAIAAARKAVPETEAESHNLKAFRDRGGKLLLYHGWADPVVPPEDTIAYYMGVEQETGAASSFARLFLVPGMNHCSGGPGASTFETLGVLDRWVTEGTAPQTILATHQEDNNTFTRPLCAYPRHAQWDGHGNAIDASSFTCVEGAKTKR